MPRNYSVAETIRRAKEKYESHNLPEEKPEELKVVAEEAQQEIIAETEPVIQATQEQKPQEEKPEGLLSKISKKLKWW